MNKIMGTAVTGVTLGVIAGTAAYMMSGKGKAGTKNRSRQMKKNAGKALHGVSTFIDNVSYMMK